MAKGRNGSSAEVETDRAAPPFIDSELPNPEPGDLGDFERFAVRGDPIDNQAVAVVCKVGRPGNGDFFRTYPDRKLWISLHVLEMLDENKNRVHYLVDPSLVELDELDALVKGKLLVPWVSTDGEIGLWPLSVENTDNAYVSSALRIVEIARVKWVVARGKRKIGQYKMVEARRQDREPSWPDMSAVQWLAMAFPPEMRITTADHPILARLRGE